ncbi:MAG: 2-oxoglutarate dehydrogenase complex dihydrolipoyllysine-residue succinyltransferase [Rhodospirillaceae bacterium]|nr:2-oxoglutarate dehydrogenase complex dihydrolipoyllysine-residue succinyltransferase [Rhodospirillaceae bacterium]
MTVDIKVPALGESVTEAEVAKWYKQIGDAVEADEPLVELETDKVTLEVNAPAAGTLAEILAGEGAEVEVGAVLGRIDETGAGVAAAPARAAPEPEPEPEPGPEPDALLLSPAVRKLVAEHELDPAAIEGTGKDGRLLKADVEAHLAAQAAAAGEAAASEPEPTPEPAPPPQAPPPTPGPKRAPNPAPAAEPREAGEREVRVRMSRLRRRIAERLKEAQNTAAMLTTFNDADMDAILDLRKRYRDSFEKRHGVRLGFMSFFVKACIEALKEIPAVNAEIDGDDIVYKNYYDIGVAVGTEQGLVVPVLRDADGLSFAEIERTITELGAKARDGALSMAELTGGTFTISNGGVYGSMLSTPILNPPQSGILGMHRIEQRPVARDGQVVIRPMMYLALSYDHRIVDGREAVTFLVKVKEGLEDPERLLIGV